MQLYFKFIKFYALGFLLVLIVIASCAAQTTISDPAIPLSTDKIEFTGKILADKDISALGFVGKYLLIGADEGNTIQVLEPDRDSSKYRVARNIELPIIEKSKAEVDVEGIAISGNSVYVVGSHSVNKKSQAKKQNNRQSIYRFQLNPDSSKLESAIARASLHEILDQDLVLSQFANLKRQKNGVDIEGLAVKNGLLYFGFRTPILEEKYVPVIGVNFQDIDRSDKYKLYYVNLEGNGIRDIVSVNDGFLILADATGSDKSYYQVYFWDGSDDLPRAKTAPGTKFLSKIPTEKNTKAEGLTILTETNSSYQVLLVYDGVAKGNPTVLEINK